MKHVLIEYLNDSSYVALLTTLSSNSPIELIKEFVVEDGFECSGKVIVDTVLFSGNNSDRFLEIKCDQGKVDFNTINYVNLERKDELRIKANDILRKYPSIVNNSILNSSQKKLLLHGISI